MSHNHKVALLKEGLEKWNAHNETHARPSDKILYELLKELFELFQIPEMEEGPVKYEEPSDAVSDDESGGPGGNNPDAPVIP